MRISDNLRLGMAGIKAKKWRHALMVVTMGAVLGLVVALGLGIAGLERAVRIAEPQADVAAAQVSSLALSNVKIISALDLFLAAVPVKTPMVAYEINADKTFGEMWGTYNIMAGVLMVVGLLITVLTLVRLLGQEEKNQRLYQAEGATPGDLRKVYGCYALILGGLTCLLAVAIGVALTLILSATHAEALAQVFELAYGVEMEVWLIDWNWRVGVVLAVTLMVMTLTGVLGVKRKV